MQSQLADGRVQGSRCCCLDFKQVRVCSKHLLLRNRIETCAPAGQLTEHAGQPPKLLPSSRHEQIVKRTPVTSESASRRSCHHAAAHVATSQIPRAWPAFWHLLAGEPLEAWQAQSCRPNLDPFTVPLSLQALSAVESHTCPSAVTFLPACLCRLAP